MWKIKSKSFGVIYTLSWASQVAPVVKNLPANTGDVLQVQQENQGKWQSEGTCPFQPSVKSSLLIATPHATTIIPHNSLPSHLSFSNDWRMGLNKSLANE